MLLSGDMSTDSPSADENTEEPDLSTNLAIAEDGETADVHAEDNALAGESDSGETESENKSRKKRKADDRDDHQDDLQHLGQITKELDSSQLPVEHRGGFDDDDSHEHHQHNGSTQLITPWFSVISALLLFAGLTRMHHL